MKTYNIYTYGMISPQNWKQQTWGQAIKEMIKQLALFTSGLIITSGVITFFYVSACLYSNKI